MSEAVVDYGWEDATEKLSGGYLYPVVSEVLRRHAPRRVLDIGCGNGALTSRFSKQGYEMVGVEYDPKGVELAKQHHRAIPFYNFGVGSDADLLLREEQPFDAAISTEVIEHLFAPHMLPQYAARVLKPKGKLILTTPYHGYLKNVLVSLCGKWDFHHTALWHGGHIKFWSRSTLTELLEANGFRVLEFHGAGRLPYLWKSMILVAEKA